MRCRTIYRHQTHHNPIWLNTTIYSTQEYSVCQWSGVERTQGNFSGRQWDARGAWEMGCPQQEHRVSRAKGEQGLWGGPRRRIRGVVLRGGSPVVGPTERLRVQDYLACESKSRSRQQRRRKSKSSRRSFCKWRDFPAGTCQPFGRVSGVAKLWTQVETSKAKTLTRQKHWGMRPVTTISNWPTSKGEMRMRGLNAASWLKLMSHRSTSGGPRKNTASP